MRSLLNSLRVNVETFTYQQPFNLRVVPKSERTAPARDPNRAAFSFFVTGGRQNEGCTCVRSVTVEGSDDSECPLTELSDEPLSFEGAVELKRRSPPAPVAPEALAESPSQHETGKESKAAAEVVFSAVLRINFQPEYNEPATVLPLMLSPDSRISQRLVFNKTVRY